MLARLLPSCRWCRGGRGRPPREVRVVIHGLLYRAKTGVLGRWLPASFGPWQTVYSYFHRWRQPGVWKRILDALTRRERPQQGRKPTPAAGIVDAQSVTLLIRIYHKKPLLVDAMIWAISAFRPPKPTPFRCGYLLLKGSCGAASPHYRPLQFPRNGDIDLRSNALQHVEMFFGQWDAALLTRLFALPLQAAGHFGTCQARHGV